MEIFLGNIKGRDGNPGADGYTPQRGSDYFTPEDIEYMVQEVLSRAGTSGAVREIRDSTVYLDQLLSGAYSLVGSSETPQSIYYWDGELFTDLNKGVMFIVLASTNLLPNYIRKAFILYPQTNGVLYIEFCPSSGYKKMSNIKYEQLGKFTPSASKTLDSFDSGTYLLMGKYYWNSDKTSYYDTGEATKLCSIIKTNAKVVLSECPNTWNSTYVYSLSDKSVISSPNGIITIVEGEVSSLADLMKGALDSHNYLFYPIGRFNFVNTKTPIIVNKSNWSGFNGIIDFTGELLLATRTTNAVNFRMITPTRDYLFSAQKYDSDDYNKLSVFSTPILSKIQSTNNLTTSVGPESTDEQYPSAKAVHDFVLSSEQSVDEALDRILEIQEELLIPNGDEVKY